MNHQKLINSTILLSIILSCGVAMGMKNTVKGSDVCIHCSDNDKGNGQTDNLDLLQKKLTKPSIRLYHEQFKEQLMLDYKYSKDGLLKKALDSRVAQLIFASAGITCILGIAYCGFIRPLSTSMGFTDKALSVKSLLTTGIAGIATFAFAKCHSYAESKKDISWLKDYMTTRYMSHQLKNALSRYKKALKNTNPNLIQELRADMQAFIFNRIKDGTLSPVCLNSRQFKETYYGGDREYYGHYAVEKIDAVYRNLLKEYDTHKAEKKYNPFFYDYNDAPPLENYKTSYVNNAGCFVNFFKYGLDGGPLIHNDWYFSQYKFYKKGRNIYKAELAKDKQIVLL